MSDNHNVLVTGGAGFIGSHLTDRLVSEGYRVTVVDNLSTGSRNNVNPAAAFHNLDIRDGRLSGIFKEEKIDTVFHLAAQVDLRKSVEDPFFDAETNVLGSLNLLMCAGRAHAERVVFSSSGGAMYNSPGVFPTPETHCPNPISPYGIHKLAVEMYLGGYMKIFNVPSVSLRYANVYGPRQNSLGEAGVVAIFCDRILSGKDVLINGDGNQTRDFVYVEDVVEANIMAMKSGDTGVFNIGTGREIAINQVVKELEKITKRRVQVRYGPAKSGEEQRSCLSSEKARIVLGWQPKHTFEAGLEKTIAWFQTRQ